MTINSVAQATRQETSEYLGDDLHGVYRPEIKFENLNVSDVCNVKDGFCDALTIPLIPAENEKLAYEFMFCYLVDQVADGFQDAYPQPVNLSLIVDDNNGERKYYLGANVQIKDEDEQEVSTEEIYPNAEELTAINLALLKITERKLK